MSELIQSPLLCSTMMLTGAALLAAFVLRVFSVRSAALQSMLLLVVLLQGVMFVRSPIHLGLLPAEEVTERVEASGHPAMSIDSQVQARNLEPPPAGTIQLSNASRSSLNTTTASAARSVRDWPRIESLLFWTWFAGLMGFVALAAKRYWRLIRAVEQLPPAADAWQQEWDTVLETHRWQRGSCELLISQAAGPMIVRLPRRWVFVVPESYWKSLNRIQRRSVMIHEAAHLARKDVWRSLCARGVATLHWFNPIAWRTASRLDEAAELACDQAVAAHGPEYRTEFATALIALVSTETGTDPNSRSVACLAMATPPLTRRFSQLLEPNSQPKDPLMKRFLLVCFVILIGIASCVQFRLSAADDSDAHQKNRQGQLRVLSERHASEINDFIATLDTSDSHTRLFAGLVNSDGGKMAISSYVDQLQGSASRELRSNALEKFVESHFERNSDGLVPSDAALPDRWRKATNRLQESSESLQAVANELAQQLESDQTEAALLLKRFLRDPQASVAILLFELQSGGDPIAAFVSKAFEKVLVERGDGKFQVLGSAEAEAQKQIDRFELAGLLAKKLKRQMPVFAMEFDTGDPASRKLTKYFKNPMTATVVAIHLSEKPEMGAARMLEEVFKTIESQCDETAAGLRLCEGEVQKHMDQIFEFVDRTGKPSPRIKERLAEMAQSMADDEMSQAVAELLLRDELAVAIAAEIPYSDSMAGDHFRALLDQVVETDDSGGLKVRPQKADELAQQIKGLLQTCRQIRRHAVTVEDVLNQLADKQLVNDLGDLGKYIVLDSVRRFAESHRPDVMDLLAADLVERTADGAVRVKTERRQLVTDLVKAASELDRADNQDDF